MKPPITIEDLIAKCGPTMGWEGKCAGIAHVASILIPGSFEARGHWYGPLKGYWAKRAGAIFQPHSWVLMPDRVTILDPTRWSFEGVQPYIFMGKEGDHMACDMFCGNTSEEDEECHCGHFRDQHKSGFLNGCKICLPWPYDEGGNRDRERMRRPVPTAPKHVPMADCHDIALCDVGVAKKIIELLDGDCPTFGPTLDQCVWLANLPVSEYGKYAKGIYEWLEFHDLKAFIPIDNYEMITR